MDKISRDARSEVMRRVRSKDTKPELFIRKGIFRLGFRYRLHCRHLPGKPDLYFPKYKAVVFVNGCFWHSHKCKRARIPADNRNYWEAKLSRNFENDRKNWAALIANGFRVMVVWECSLKASTQIDAIQLLAEWLSANCPSSQITSNGRTELLPLR